MNATPRDSRRLEISVRSVGMGFAEVAHKIRAKFQVSFQTIHFSSMKFFCPTLQSHQIVSYQNN